MRKITKHLIGGLVLTTISVLAQAQIQGNGTISGNVTIMAGGIAAVRHPGDAVAFIVSFEGKDVGEVVGSALRLDLISSKPADQQAFSNSLSLGRFEKISPGVFKLSVEIPATIASGQYKLAYVDADIPGGLAFTYAKDLPDLKITIENPARFTMPTIRGVVESPR